MKNKLKRLNIVFLVFAMLLSHIQPVYAETTDEPETTVITSHESETDQSASAETEEAVPADTKQEAASDINKVSEVPETVQHDDPETEPEPEPMVEPAPSKAPLRDPAGDTPSNAVEKTVQFDFYDMEGNLLSNAEIAKGVKFIIYEFPQSADTFSPDITEEELLEKLKQYRKEITIYKQGDTTYSLTMESDASPDNKYTLAIATFDELYSMTGKPGTDSDFYSRSYLQYDGISISNMDGYITEDEDGVLHVITVKYKMINTNITFKMDLEDFIAQRPDLVSYPIYATVYYRRNGIAFTMVDGKPQFSVRPDYSYPINIVLDKDGEYTVNLGQTAVIPRTSSSQMPAQLNFSFYSDEQRKGDSLIGVINSDVENEGDYYYVSNDGGSVSFYVELQEDGSFHYHAVNKTETLDKVVEPTFIVNAKLVQPSFVLDVADNTQTGVYPFYAKATLTGTEGNKNFSIEKVIEISSVSERHEVKFDDYLLDNATISNLTFELYKDAECTQKTDDWRYFTGGASGMDETGALVFNSGVPAYCHIEAAKAVPKFRVDVSSTNTYDFPAYVKVRLYGTVDGNPFEEVKTIKLEGNTQDTFSFDNPVVVFNNDTNLEYEFVNEDGTHNDNWDIKESINCAAFYDGNLFVNSPGDYVTIRVRKTGSLKIPFIVNLDAAKEAEYFPATLKLQITDNETGKVVSEYNKEITSLSEIENTIIAEGNFASSRQYTVNWTIDCANDTAQLKKWVSGNEVISVNGNMMAMKNDERFSIVYGLCEPAIKIHAPHPGISYEDFDLPPVWYKISVYDERVRRDDGYWYDINKFETEEPLASRVIKLDDEHIDQEVSVDEGFMFYADSSHPFYVYYMPYTSESLDEIDKSWLSSYYQPWTTYNEITGYASEIRYQKEGTTGNYYYSGKFVYEPYWHGVPVTLKAHVECDEGIDPSEIQFSGKYSSYSSWCACFVLEVYKMTSSGLDRIDGYQHYTYGNYQYDDAFAQYFSELGTFDYPIGYLQPGEYYISWFEDNIGSNWRFPSTYDDRNKNWTGESQVKVIVREDGVMYFEDGTPVEITIKYVKAVNDGWITPILNIETKIIGNITSNDSAPYIQIRGDEDDNKDIDWWVWMDDYNITDYSITGTLEDIYEDKEHYRIGITGDNRDGCYVEKWLGTNVSLICLKPGKYTVNYYDRDNREGWSEGTDIKVEFKEDGKLYLIDEDGNTTDEELIIKHHMKPALDKAVLKVNTVVDEKVKHRFTEGDKLEVILYRGDCWRNKETLVEVARGSAEITAAGKSEVELTRVNGETIYVGNMMGIIISGNEDEQPGYSILIRTVHSDGTVNNMWSWVEEYNVNVKNDGYIELGDNNNGYRSDEYQNISYLLSYPDEVKDPDEISSKEDGIVFKPVDKIAKFSNKAHYMIIVKNPKDGKWYALNYDEDSGYRVLLKDFDIADVKTNGFKVAEGDLSQSGYIFTASKVSYAEDAVTAQLKTGVKNEDGKQVGLKFGSGSTNVEPMFDGSTGTLTLSINGKYDDDIPTFSVAKNTYAYLNYVNEWFGFRGFQVFGPRYMKFEYAIRNTIDGTEYTELVYPNDPYVKYDSEYYRFINDRPYTFGDKENTYLNSYAYEMAEKFETEEYYNHLIETNGSNYKPLYSGFIILTDNRVTEEEEKNNEYKLVKTMGDFMNTFVQSNGSKAMVLVYTDEEGKEYALNPKGLVRVKTSELSSDYRKLTAGANNEMIVNNYCRNSDGETVFGFELKDFDGDGTKAVVTGYPFRKNRTNNYADGEYLTMNGKVWTGNDKVFDDSLAYVLYPTDTVYSIADFDKKLSYQLCVYRNGVQSWLGVKDGQMVIVDTQEEAVVFDIYSDNLIRFFPDVDTTNYAPYYRISSLNDINEGDEILIVYDHDGTKEVLSNVIYDYSSYYYHRVLAPVVSEEYGEYDVNVDPYKNEYNRVYRLNSNENIKKVYAYYPDAEDESLIFSQALITHLVGDLKGEGKNQKKFYSVESLYQNSYNGYKLTIKADNKGLYRSGNAETSFIYEDGQFYIRGGKSTAWLGISEIQGSTHSYITGWYEYFTYTVFDVKDTEERIPVIIYKKGSPNLITVNYHDQDGTVASESKSEGIIALPQYEDGKINNEDYIFVGWSTDPDVTQVLPLEESANLYDFDDISRVAAVREEIAEKYSLLGNCNPEKGNTVKIMAEDLENATLDLYAVYARRGGSNVVTANDGEKMIIGIADVKDLEEGRDGTTDSRERWLGSVNVEIYKDGEIWVPGQSTSTTIKRLAMSKHGPRRAPAREKATMYFAYHNDDAADINIKFIADTVTKEMLDEYLTNSDFSSAEPSEQYVIDAVYAEQGGSEDGLKYKYNWLDPIVGGQLDNVRGGSTVKVYVTTRYQVKYYMDKGYGNGYQELTDEKYQDENFYMTPGTDTAVADNRENADYIVKDEEGNEYRMLIQKTPNDTDKFVDDNIRRGEYSVFQYEFNTHNNVFPVPELPEAPEGYFLDSDKWTIRDAGMAEVGTRNPSSDFTIEGTSYGTGNTNMSYLNEDYEDVTNTYHLYIKVTNTKLTSVPVKKVWEDSNDNDGIRPEEITVKLLANGKETGDTLILSDENKWTGEFKDLPETDDSGEIKYTVIEVTVRGYTPEITEDKDGFTITNTHAPETTELSVTKKWEDDGNRDGLRPEKITVKLIADGKDTGKSLELTEKEKWTRKFSDLPKKAAGKDIKYTIEEVEVKGYIVKVEEAEGGYNVINTHTPETTELSVTKKWEDDGNRDGLRPEKVTVKLIADGKDTGKSLELTEKDKWTGKFSDLPKKADGKDIKYTIEEVEVKGYIVKVEEAENGYTLTNIHESSKVSLTVIKEWKDRGDEKERPVTLTIALLADGEVCRRVELNKANNWKATLEDLPEYADGKKISYSWQETIVPKGYKLTSNKTEGTITTITNTLTDIPDTGDNSGMGMYVMSFCSSLAMIVACLGYLLYNSKKRYF